MHIGRIALYSTTVTPTTTFSTLEIKNKRYDEVVKEEDRVGSYGRLSINGELEVEEERSWEDVEKDLKSAEIKALFCQVKPRAKDLNVSKTGWWKKY